MAAKYVSYGFFGKNCKNCEFHDVRGDGFKHYCHYDKNTNSGCKTKQRIRIVETNSCCCKVDYYEDRAEEKQSCFYRGFSDCMNGEGFNIGNKYNDELKVYVEGYSKAMLLKGNADDGIVICNKNVTLIKRGNQNDCESLEEGDGGA